MTNFITDLSVLIGKHIQASGWEYDFGWALDGNIEKIEKSKYRCEMYEVSVKGELTEDEKTHGVILTQNFDIRQLNMLIRDGFLPKPNRLLNTGTSAIIKN